MLWSILTVVMMHIAQLVSGASKQDTVYAKNHETSGGTLSELINNAPADAVIVLEGKVYKTKQVRIPHHLTLLGQSGTKIQPLDGTIFNALIIAAHPIEIENVILDGDKRAFWGIYSTSDLSVTNVTITNFYGNDKAPGNGIRHLPESDKNRLCVINSVIENISGFNDGKVGNYIGAHRGVLTSGGNIVIQNTKFENILGEEDADCIHIQTKDDSKDSWGSAGNAIIENCSFHNFGKRAIKIQASDVVVKNNKIRNEGNKIYSAISIYGSRNIVDNNQIDVSNATAALTVISGNQNRLRNNTVIVDREEGGRLSWGVAFDKASKTTLSGNTFITNGKRTPFSFSKSITSSNRRSMERNNQVQTRKQ